MTILYTYVRRPHSVMTDGIKSPFAADEDRLFHYAKRAGSVKKEDILNYLETVFSGRSRAVSCLTETAPRTENPKIKNWANACDCFSFDLDPLIKENIVQSIFCADAGTFTLTDARMIDCSPLNWESVNPYDNVFFQRIRHYMIVLKDGVLPVKFIRPV